MPSLGYTINGFSATKIRDNFGLKLMFSVKLSLFLEFFYRVLLQGENSTVVRVVNVILCGVLKFAVLTFYFTHS
jgi:hypothetical protein